MQRYFGKCIDKNNVLLKEEDFKHIKKVMRMKENAKVTVVIDNICYLCSLNSDLESAKILEVVDKEINSLNVILVVPILSEDKMSLIIEKSTELGVKEIIPVNMFRCKFKINKEKEEKKVLRWNKIAKEAAEQSMRLDEVIVHPISNLKDLKLKNVNILCSTDKSGVKSMPKVLKGVKYNDIIQVVFGPEGGFTKEEQEYLVNLGFTKTTFGNRILRTETVPLFVLSIINYINME